MVATKVMQAMKTTYGAVANFIRLNPNLEAQVLRYTAFGSARIEVPGTNSVVYPMADKPDGLQGLDPTMAVLDEAAFADLAVGCVGAGVRPAAGVEVHRESAPRRSSLRTRCRRSRRAYRSGQDLPSFTFIEHSAPEGCDYRDERVWPLANPGLVTKPPILGIDALRMDVAMMPEQHFRCFVGAMADGGRVAGSVTTGRRCGTSSPTRSSSFRVRRRGPGWT